MEFTLDIDLKEGQVVYKLYRSGKFVRREISPKPLLQLKEQTREFTQQAQTLFANPERSPQDINDLYNALRDLGRDCFPKQILSCLKSGSHTLQLVYSNPDLSLIPWDAILAALPRSRELLVSRTLPDTVHQPTRLSVDDLPLRVVFILNSASEPALHQGAEKLKTIRSEIIAKCESYPGRLDLNTGLDRLGEATREQLEKALRSSHILVFYGRMDRDERGRHGLVLSNGDLVTVEDIDEIGSSCLEDEPFPRLILCVGCAAAPLVDSFGQQGVEFFFGAPWSILTAEEPFEFTRAFLFCIADTLFDQAPMRKILCRVEDDLRLRFSPLSVWDYVFKVGALDDPLFNDPEIEVHLKKSQQGNLDSVEWLLRYVPSHPCLTSVLIHLLNDPNVSPLSKTKVVLLLVSKNIPPGDLLEGLSRTVHWQAISIPPEIRLLSEAVIHYLQMDEEGRQVLISLANDSNTNPELCQVIHQLCWFTRSSAKTSDGSFTPIRIMLEALARSPEDTEWVAEALSQYLDTDLCNVKEVVRLAQGDDMPYAHFARAYLSHSTEQTARWLNHLITSDSQLAYVLAGLVAQGLGGAIDVALDYLMNWAQNDMDVVRDALMALTHIPHNHICVKDVEAGVKALIHDPAVGKALRQELEKVLDGLDSKE